MFTLSNVPIEHIEINGVKYTLFLSFDNVIRLFEMFNDDELSKDEKFFVAVQMLFDAEEIIDLYEDIEILEKVFTHVIEEIIAPNGSKQSVQYDLLGNVIPNAPQENEADTSAKKTYDLTQDAEYIFASFLQDYGINLHEEIGKMHWHTFQALFNGLSENTKMMKVIEIRTCEVPSGKGMQKEAERIKKLKQTYKLA